MEELSLNLHLLALSGIVEPPFVSGSLWKRYLFSLYMVTSVLVFIPVLLGELLALYHFWGDLVVITNNVFTLVGNVTFYGEALYIIARRGEFLMLMKKLQDMLEHMPRPGAEQKKIAEKATKRSRALTWSMLVMVYMVPFSWSMSPLVGMLFSNGEDVPEKSVLLEDEVEVFWKSLISIMWLPLHDIQSPVKEIIYVGQVFVFLITASYYISVNTVFVSFIVQTTGQFEILLATVHEMDRAVESWDLAPPQVTGDFTDTVLVDVFGSKETKTIALRWLHRRDDPSDLRSYFLDVIRHHQAIIAFSKQLNDVLSPLLFFYFYSAQIMMCVMAFQMVLTWGQQNNFLKFLFGLLCVLAGPFFFCWQGNTLIEKSVEVERAVYGSEWYNRSESFKRMVQLVIARAQRPVSLTAGKLYIVSMETFAKMLNTVYYYFAVLKQLHEK